MYNFTITKNPKFMRSIFTLAVIVLLGSFFVSAQKVQINNSPEKGNYIKTVSAGITEFEIIADPGSLSLFEVNTKGGFFNSFSLENMITDGVYGDPALPVFRKLVQMPVNGVPVVEILSYDEEIIDLNTRGAVHTLMPAQPSLSKSDDPDKVPFYYNASSYMNDNFNDRPVASVEKLGEMRGVIIGRLTVCPVQYNPASNQLKLFRNLHVRVTFNNADVQQTITKASQHYSPLFEPLYSRLINHTDSQLKDTLIKIPVKYLIISDRMFEAGLQTFIEWKTKKGFFVQVAYTDVIGTTTTAIKSYIAGVYNAGTPADPAPSYVLFVGDVAQIPAFNGTTGSHPTDLYYVEMDGGGDYFPEMYFGRFSAQNTTHLQTYVSKTLQFEKYLMPDPSYLQYSLLVAGCDASNAPTYGNGQINYATDNYFNAAHNVISHTYLYGSGSPITSDDPAASAAIIQNVRDGVGFANYTAHCSEDGWADPSFVVSDVATLTNTNKYCVMVGNCCLSNKFNVSECFGEAITRTPERGAIAYLGGSNSTYWNEDYYYSVGVSAITANPTYATSGLGYYDKLFHDHGEAFSNWYVTTGGINFGGNLAVSEGSTSDDYYWEIYHVMGDPSVMPYLWIPSPLIANYLTTVPIGVPAVDINTEEHAYVALSLNGVLKEAQYTGTATTITMDLTFVTMPCTLDVVITKQNRQPHIGQIVVVPNNSPYVVYFSHALNDAAGNNNHLADYSEDILMDLTLKNVGNLDAINVTATLTTASPYVTITDPSDVFGSIASSATSTATQGYGFSVGDVIPDQNNALFVVSSTNGTDVWTTNFSVVLNAPALSVPAFFIDDAVLGNGNNRLDPGENLSLIFNTLNGGHSVSPNATSTLTCASPYISIINSSVNLNTIGISQTTPASFDILVEAGTPVGTPVTFVFSVDASGYTATKTVTLPVGLIVEDFESNTFTEFPWSATGYGDAPWIIINSGNIYEGAYSARSGIITDDQTSVMSMTVTVLSADTLSFFKKVSCEAPPFPGYYYDYLEFLIDGASKNKWGGEIGWSRQAYYLTTGAHTLTWKYLKDNSVAEGDDAAWVDFIVFPSIDIPLANPSMLSIAQSLSVYPNPFGDDFSICYGLSKTTQVDIAVYNMLGQKVLTVAEDLTSSAGNHVVPVSAGILPSGYYIIIMSTQFGGLKTQIVKTK